MNFAFLGRIFGKLRGRTGPAVGTVENKAARPWEEPDEWATRVAFEPRAIEAARRNDPPADAMLPPDPLPDLMTYQENGGQRFAELATQASENARTTIDDNAIEAFDLKRVLARIVDAGNKHSADYRDRIVTASQRAAEAARNLRAFRASRGLRRPARSSPNIWTASLQLAFLMLLESFGNAWFLKAAVDTGAIGGFLMALSVSVINVVCLGFFVVGKLGFRLGTSHEKNGYRWAGWALVVGGGIAALLLNLGLAHYRDASFTENSDPVRAVLVVFWQPLRWFDFHDFMSFMLLLLGLVCCAFGVYKGITIDDPVWNYASTTREAEAAAAQRDDLREELKAKISGIVDEYRAIYNDRHEQNAAALAAVREALRTVETQLEALGNGLVAFDRRCQTLWRRFFDIARRVRTPGTAFPAWHDPPHSVASLCERFPSLEKLAGLVAVAETTHAANAELLNILDVHLEDMRRRLLDRFFHQIDDADRRGDIPRNLEPPRGNLPALPPQARAA